jgi:hypothetical protein
MWMAQDNFSDERPDQDMASSQLIDNETKALEDNPYHALLYSGIMAQRQQANLEQHKKRPEDIDHSLSGENENQAEKPSLILTSLIHENIRR